MKLFVFCTVVLELAIYADATVTFTTPATGGGSVPDCTGMSSVDEGTTSGVIETVDAATDALPLNLALATATDAIFDLDTTNNQISIADGTALDFEATGGTVTLTIEGTDANTGGGAAVTAQCKLTLNNKAPAQSGIRSDEIIVPASTTSGATVTTVTCSDGAGTISSFADVTGNSNKFDIDTGTGVVTKSATAFASSDTYWIQKYTCNDGVGTATVTFTLCYDSKTNCPNTAASQNGILAMLLPPAVYMVYQLF